ncbi:MAG: serine O-acetyltransferase [Planctomycetota bacterium]
MKTPAPTEPHDAEGQPPPAAGDLHHSRLLGEVLEAVLATYPLEDRTSHIDATFLPSRERAIEVIELLRRVLFPGFFDPQRVTSQNVKEHIGSLLSRVDALLFDQVRQSLRYGENRGDPGAGDGCDDCDVHARQITDAFLQAIPELRRMLALDVQAAFDGDPAAVNTDEAVFCYPGIDAIYIHRVAHKLCRLGVPMLPRIMSEYAHNETGVDIHPGATIGASFFIDHGTGVVIGETCDIGKRVKVYQGVTLGALSTKGGQAWRGRKRHPTIEDDVTIYAGATILGGDTVIGARSTISGSVFITSSVPADHSVLVDHPTPRLKARRGKKPIDPEIDLGQGI